MDDGIVVLKDRVPQRGEVFGRGLGGGDVAACREHIEELLVSAGHAFKILLAVHNKRHGQQENAQLLGFFAGDAAVCIGYNCYSAHFRYSFLPVGSICIGLCFYGIYTIRKFEICQYIQCRIR